MKVYNLPFHKIGTLTPLINAYLQGLKQIQPLYKLAPTLNNFNTLLNNSPINAWHNLHTVLTQQYKHLSIHAAVQNNLNLLTNLNKVRFVCTAHQPNLCTGPLYFIYKICSTINLSNMLQQQHPNYTFIPIYWMGSEDHDFEEINHFNIFGKTLTWNTPAGGAVGRLTTTEIKEVLNQLQPLIENLPYGNKLIKILNEAYLQHPTLAQATQFLVNQLFGKYGLLIINQDDALLKQAFIPIAKAELLQQQSYKTVLETNQLITNLGYHAQAFPRPINLFYLGNNFRERILFDENSQTYTITNTNLQFNTQQIIAELEQNPQNFSPNVILRPVFQQAVTAAVAYVGGGGELAYWLQLQQVFNLHNTPYPILVLRNSATLIDANTALKMQKTGLSYHDIFRDVEKLIIEYVQKNSQHTLDISIEKQQLIDIFEQILHKAVAIDTTLQTTVVGEMTKLKNTLETLENKLLRSEKRNFENATNQIRNIKEKIFPKQTLQERFDNFLPHYAKYGEKFIDNLINNLKPIINEMLIFIDTEEEEQNQPH